MEILLLTFIDFSASGVKAVRRSPLNPRTTALHAMESRYMNVFCTMMWREPSLDLRSFSLYTPANTEHRHWGLAKNINIHC